MRLLTPALLLGAMLVAAFAAAPPATAKVPPFAVTLAASPAAYTGPCPVTIKYTGEISGDAGAKLMYQVARILGGVPSLKPWVSAAIPATGKLVVLDVVTVTAAQAGVETEVLRVLPGPAEASVKVPVTCVNPNATPSPRLTPTPTPTRRPNPNATPTPTTKPSGNPTITLVNPNLRVVTPAPTSSPKIPATVSQFAPALHKLPAPINLTNRTTRDDCAAHGGSAESFACYLALPAGKPVLDWDYPFPDKIDGFNVYSADTPASSSVMSIHVLTVKPIITQGNADYHFEVLDSARPGQCFAVTAFHGNEESDRSVRYCLGTGGVAKFLTLNPDRIGTMVADFYVWVDKSVQDNMYNNYHPFIRDLLYLDIGYTHDPSLFRDEAHTQISQYTNSLFRGYLHFNTFGLSGHQIAQARLNLLGGNGPGGQICLATFGPADHLWNPGDNLNGGYGFGNGPYQGPDLHLDMTSLVQTWANSPASNVGIALNSQQHLVIYDMVILSSSCLSSIPTASLDVTYY